VRLRTAKRRRPSSSRWLERQLNDPYVAAARREGYLSRAAYKLIELDDRFHFLGKGSRVLDLGAAPGGWSQVAAGRVGAGEARGGRVVAFDQAPMASLPGVEVLEGDIDDPAAVEALKALIAGPVDVVLSDMAPAATGHRGTDHIRIVALVEAAAELALEVLAPGGAFVAKVWQGGTAEDLLAVLKQRFKSVRHAKPAASRAESAEVYLVALGFRGRASDA
jgi:23S rRNA (uridine2552-2'-O)-methyltransferase